MLLYNTNYLQTLDDMMKQQWKKYMSKIWAYFSRNFLRVKSPDPIHLVIYVAIFLYSSEKHNKIRSC